MKSDDQRERFRRFVAEGKHAYADYGWARTYADMAEAFGTKPETIRRLMKSEFPEIARAISEAFKNRKGKGGGRFDNRPVVFQPMGPFLSTLEQLKRKQARELAEQQEWEEDFTNSQSYPLRAWSVSKR